MKIFKIVFFFNKFIIFLNISPIKLIKKKISLEIIKAEVLNSLYSFENHLFKRKNINSVIS